MFPVSCNAGLSYGPSRRFVEVAGAPGLRRLALRGAGRLLVWGASPLSAAAWCGRITAVIFPS